MVFRLNLKSKAVPFKINAIKSLSFWVKHTRNCIHRADVVELVDTLVLGTSGATRGSSSLSIGTIQLNH